ncbi:hypothetical protein ACFL0D_00975 [Thermoproteota archaeon]
MDPNDYVKIEKESLDRIEVNVQREGSDPRILITYGKTSEVVEELNGVYDVIVSVRKLVDDGNPVLVRIIDQDSNILFNHVYLEPKITLNLKEITQ